MIRYDTLKAGSRVASNTRKHPNTQCSTMYYLVVHRFRLETALGVSTSSCFSAVDWMGHGMGQQKCRMRRVVGR